MKKIFTLLAGILLATGAQAQEAKTTWLAAEETPIESGYQVREISGITVTFGSTTDNNTWSVGNAATDLGAGKDVLGTTFYIKGSENPKTKGSTTKNGKIPETGTWYTFVLAESGTLTVGINLGNNKTMRLADDAGAKVEELKNTTGASIMDTKEFTLVAGTYYLYAEGSKLGLFGFKFEQKEVEEDPGTPFAATAWDFTDKLSEADIANITADEENWETADYEKENKETGETEFVCKIYQNVNKLIDEKVVANGEELTIVKGLRFNAGVGKFQVYDGVKLAHGGNGHGPVFPDCGKGDKISIRYSISDVNRGFEVSNIDPDATEGNLIGSEKGTYEATVTVKKKGDVAFASKGGADILAISVNKELPKVKDTETAIKTAKTATQQNGATYNLAGQQVNDSFKGIVIQNGKKVVK